MTRLNKKKQTIWTMENGHLTRKKDILATEEPLEILLRAGEEQKTIAITMLASRSKAEQGTTPSRRHSYESPLARTTVEGCP